MYLFFKIALHLFPTLLYELFFLARFAIDIKIICRINSNKSFHNKSSFNL